MGTYLHFDAAGELHSRDEHGNVKSPWDGTNRKAAPDPDARGDIRIGKLTEGSDGYVFEGWVFDGKGRLLAGITLDPDTLEPTHYQGWTIEELVALHAEHGEGATIPGRP
jgi:hypothetical protein